MPESLPGTVLDPTPEILWTGVDSPDQLTVVQGGQTMGHDLDWVQTRLSREGLRTRVFLNYVPGDEAFEIAVTMPEDREVQVSIRDKQVEFVHEVSVVAEAEQRVVRFAKASGRAGWVASPSYRATPSGGLRLSEAKGSSGGATLEERLAKTPEEYRPDVERLYLAAPILEDGIDEVGLVLDVSASMRQILASRLDEFARLGWCLAYAAGQAKKHCALVGQKVKGSTIEKSAEPTTWADGVRQGLAAGMETAWPLRLEETLAAIPERAVALCLTDAPPLNLPEVVAGRTSRWVVVVVCEGALGDRRRESTSGFTMIWWDQNTSLVSALMEALPNTPHS